MIGNGGAIYTANKLDLDLCTLTNNTAGVNGMHSQLTSITARTALVVEVTY
jgi:hypothetical protein